VYQEAGLNGGVLCLIKSNGAVEVVAFPVRGEMPLRNSLLVSETDVVEGVVHIDSAESLIQIYFEYPNSVYLIEFDPEYFSIKTSSIVMTLRGVGDFPPEKLTLETKRNIISRSKFEEISRGAIFSKKNLELADELDVQISASKSNIYSLPSVSKVTNMYLVKGDLVRVLSYRNGWFEFLYRTRNGKSIRGWITTSDLL
jgi:hypothetical protein